MTDPKRCKQCGYFLTTSVQVREGFCSAKCWLTYDEEKELILRMEGKRP